MSDFKNPFDPDNFSIGVGWDGKTVTVTNSAFTTDMFEFGDGNPVIDERTGEQAYSNVWAVSGISEDSEYERTEKYSIGKSLVPTNNGNSFEHKAGKPNATFNARSKAASFAKHLKESGFDLGKLVAEDGTPNAAGLIGAMLIFKAYPVLKEDGSVKVNKGGYEQYDFFPVKFVGFSKSAPQPKGEDTAVRNRAYDLITQLLEDAEGHKLTRVQVIQGVNKALKGDPDLNAVVGLAVAEDFNSAAPWKVEGTTISLS